MRTLVLTDIHANLPAFEAVLSAAGHWDNVIFLGDIANFGPYPAECVDLLRSLDPICVMGNHDAFIAKCESAWGSKNNFWDDWSREKLSPAQLEWIATWPDRQLLEPDILLTHGAYGVNYDLLPGIPAELADAAFAGQLTENVTDVWFGHYHYGFTVTGKAARYHSLRPVGHHRDGDVRASFYLWEDGALREHRTEYDLEKTIRATQRIECLCEPVKTQWLQLVRNAYHAELLQKDIDAMRRYAAQTGQNGVSRA